MKFYCKILVFICVLSSSVLKTVSVKKNKPRITKIVNGFWFDGKSFKKRTVWIKNGVFSFKKTSKKDTVIDLKNNYVIPPFAEAHNHNLESVYQLKERINSYLKNGVFYVKLLSSIKKRINPLMHLYNKPNGLDIQMAHAPLTASGGHPIALRKKFLDIGRFKGLFTSLNEIEFHGYVIIDDMNDLQKKWSKILSFQPDFIKINILYSEEYEKRKNDSTYFGKKGLNPNLIPEIVKKAHKSNLRVSAHVATAHDFHIAVNSDVDEIAHIPEIHSGKKINIDDAILAKEKGITVVTTISLVKKNINKPNYKMLLKNISNNLKILNKAGVTLAVGSDMYRDNSSKEFQFLNELNVFSNLELLKMWTENSTKTIFPKRKIGKLQNGYEASFLVLDKNPLLDISQINKSIILRVKQGVIIK